MARGDQIRPAAGSSPPVLAARLARRSELFAGPFFYEAIGAGNSRSAYSGRLAENVSKTTHI